MKPARIMIAQSAFALEITKHALRGYELVVVNDLKTAQYQPMEDDIDLFLIGIHFDESRAIDLISFIRAGRTHKRTPIVVVRFMPTTIGESLKTIAAALVKASKISEYLELENEPDADAKIRNLVNVLLPAEKVLS